jgi:hypothetical protein
LKTGKDLEFFDFDLKKENDLLKIGDKLYFLNQKLFEEYFGSKETFKNVKYLSILRISTEDWKNRKRIEIILQLEEYHLNYLIPKI